MISVIVPVYNCIHTLEKCIRAICAQTVEDWEILLIDDGSTDGSERICDRFAAEDPRIHVFHKPNGGVSSARNLGLDRANGDYVMFCDSDDYAEPEWCSKLVAAAEHHRDSFPICNYFRHSSSGKSINYAKQCNTLDETIAPEDLFCLYHLELLGTPWNKIYRQDILSKNHIRFRPDLSLGEDLVFNLDYIKFLTDGFTYINEPLYHYVLGTGQTLSTKYYPNLLGIYHIIFSELKSALTRIPDTFTRWSQDYYRSYFFAFDRVFRNTFSPSNPMPKKEKWRYNAAAFHSDAFQLCKKAIPQHFINILQYWGLQSNSFRVYWVSVLTSETLSRILHRKKTL